MATLIQETVSTDTWSKYGGRGTILPSPLGPQLVIGQTLDVHERVGMLLAQLREGQEVQVTVECRFISVDPKDLPADVRLELEQSIGKATEPRASLSHDQARDLIKSSQSVRNAGITTAPRVTVCNGGSAEVSVTSSTRYVFSYSAEAKANGTTEYLPGAGRV